MKNGSDSTETILNTEDVGVTYQESIVALKNVSLNIPAAKLTAILGPSGCGKTTLLKVIAGLIEPTSGTVKVRGKEIVGPGPDRALVFQDFALLPWATVLQNVGFGLRARGVPKKEREETSLNYIREVGLQGFEDKYPHQLSGGMRQRTGLARALTINSDILLMDEPGSGLAVEEKQNLAFWIQDIREVLGITILLIEHDLNIVREVSDKVAVLSGGELIWSGQPSDLDKDPRVVEAFIGK